MIIETGWWIIPFTVTIISLCYLFMAPYDGGYYGADVAAMMVAMALIIAILLMWLGYFIIF